MALVATATVLNGSVSQLILGLSPLSVRDSKRSAALQSCIIDGAADETFLIFEDFFSLSASAGRSSDPASQHQQTYESRTFNLVTCFNVLK